MNNWTKNQIVYSDFSDKKVSNLTIRIKTNGFVVFGKNAVLNLFFIDEYSFRKGLSNNIIKEVVDDNYKMIIDDTTQLKIVYPASYYSLVPQSYFNEYELPIYFIHAFLKSDENLYDFNYSKLDKSDVICVNAIKKGLIDELKNIFPTATLIADTQVKLNTCFKNDNIENKKSTLFLSFFDDKVDEMLFVKDRIVLMNRVEYHTVETFIYHVLNAITQAQLTTEMVEVALFGDVQKQSNIVLTLSKYFDKLRFMKPDEYDISSENAHLFIIETNS